MPDTIVLIHGFWVTPRSWEDWKARYEARGYNVLTPAYPGLEVEVEALNEDPTPLEQLTVPAIVEHLESVVGGLDQPPIIMGHSAGGVFTQLLLDKGYGAAGGGDQLGADRGRQARAAGAGEGDVPGAEEPGQPAPRGRLHARPVELRVHQRLPEEESRRLYERYHIPASGMIFWGSALANIHPGKDDTWVDYENDDRAPLLFISGSDDHLMPPSIQQSNAKHYKSETRSPRSRSSRARTCCPRGPGWEDVADYALDWAERHAREPSQA